MTLYTFIAKHGIGFNATLVDSNPNMTDMPTGSTHWKCQIRKGRRSMTVYFSQGPAVCREPTAADVLDCLASDASTLDNARSFEEWARELGYDEDSRKTEKTYRAVESQSQKLRNVLGDAFESLLYKTDRL